MGYLILAFGLYVLTFGSSRRGERGQACNREARGSGVPQGSQYSHRAVSEGWNGDPGLAEAVKKDVIGIGFNNINYAYDANSQKQVDQIRIVPVDLNENGVIDKDEDFYNERDEIVDAIAAGKYPSPPARLLHLVSQGKPQRKVVIEFIQWILADGQRYIPESGYISLTEEKIRDVFQ